MNTSNFFSNFDPSSGFINCGVQLIAKQVLSLPSHLLPHSTLE